MRVAGRGTHQLPALLTEPALAETIGDGLTCGGSVMSPNTRAGVVAGSILLALVIFIGTIAMVASSSGRGADSQGADDGLSGQRAKGEPAP